MGVSRQPHPAHQKLVTRHLPCRQKIKDDSSLLNPSGSSGSSCRTNTCPLSESFWVSQESKWELARYLPSYVRRVHSLPHMVLLTGIIANVLLFLQLVWYWKYWEDQRHGPWDYADPCRSCFKRPFSKVVIASCVFAVISFQLLHMELIQYSSSAARPLKAAQGPTCTPAPPKRRRAACFIHPYIS